MVETERPHRSRRRSTSEFFLCFSSRSTASAASSSSMKISSKSILSPGRSRESSMSLSSSLSRRLRSNGSMKGGQASPMFPTGSKKKGSGSGGSFEPPEPSSPKVTCIGQVRVKSKKKHGRKKLRTSSQRRGEVSFRKTEQTQDGTGAGNGIGIHHQQPQRWVHLSLSICETLRAFGAEFNCFVPCGRSSSSCSWSGDREKGGDKRRGGRSSNSCGAVFARWLFALQESEEKGREAGVPAREEEERIQTERRQAREIEMEVSEEEEEVKRLDTTRGDAKEEEEEEEIEEGRESICIPPKNALLLMRSRSAPFRMSSLANRFWESPAPQDKEDNYNKFEDDDEEELELEIHNYVSVNGEKQREAVTREAAEEDRNGSSSTTTTDCGNQTKLDAEETKEEEMVEKWSPRESLQEPQIPSKEEEMLEPQGDERGMVEENPQIHRKDEVLDKGSSSPEAFEDSILKVEEEEEEEEKTRVVVVVEKKEERRVSFSSSTIYLEPESETEEEDEEQEEIESSWEQITEKSIEEEKENTTLEPTTLETTNVSSQDPREQEEKPVLPECLLLMMCEPKLSMEVSKETWVCSNDFIRCRPSEKKKLVQKKIEQGEDAESKTKKTDTTSESKTVHPVPRRHQQKKKDEFQVQPPRSSYSKVEQAMKKQSMATAVGQKLSGGGGAYEPFVLKRCKSEPMRRTDKLSGEVCLWKKNKLESHRPPELPVGVGATGVGF